MKQTAIWCLAALVAGGVWIGATRAEDGGDPGAGMQMPEWAKVNDHHKALHKFVGEWVVTTPQFQGRTVTKAMHGGRYIRSHFTAEMGPVTFKGEWTVTYSNAGKTFQSLWFDNHAPHLYQSSGSIDEKGTMTLTGRNPAQATHELVDGKMVIQWEDDDTYLMIFSEKNKDGAMQEVARMKYSRVKK